MKMKKNKEKRQKLKLQSGMICTFDAFNALKGDENEVTHVVVLELIKKKIFDRKHQLWKVCDYDDPDAEPIVVTEESLYPANITAIRFPANIPNFNDIDLDTLKYCESVINSAIQSMPVKDKRLINAHNRLKAIVTKIEFCIKMKEL